MTYPWRGIRFRIAARFVAGFAVLLTIASIGLYVSLDRGYRTDFDRRLVESARATQGLYDRDRPEYRTGEAAAAHIVTELIFADRSVSVVASDGTLIGVSRRFPGAPVIEELPFSVVPAHPTTIQLSSGPARVFSFPLTSGIRANVAMSLGPLERQLARLRLIMLVGLPVILLAGGAIGVAEARSALRPIQSMAESADRIAEQIQAGAMELDPLPPHTIGDEITRLTTAFETVMARGQEALNRERATAERQRTFVADAAHELRTPVAILQNRAEVALQGTPGPEEYRLALSSIAEEARNLGAIVSNLLLLARADASVPLARRERIYLDDLVNDVFRRMQALGNDGNGAPANRLRRGEFEAAPVLGDHDLLERAILALVHNAIVHAAPSSVEVSTGVDGDWSWVRVQDWGPGVEPALQHRIFERFARFDHESSGSGLGLPIARWIAEAHGGTVGVASEPGHGATFTLRIPAARVT